VKFNSIRRAVDDLAEKLALISEPRVSSLREGKQQDFGHDGHADGHGAGQGHGQGQGHVNGQGQGHGDGQGVGHVEQQPGVYFTNFVY
jgi:hypothetical protein